jgi:trk system potassium uptake protein TrkA
MKQRIFIIGAGRFGTHLATRLSELGCEIIIADKSEKRIEDLTQDGFHAIEMDAEDEDALREAGVQDAEAVVVSIGENLQGSVLTTLHLKQLKVKRIICRALDMKHATVLEKVGADLVVLPSRDMAYRLAERLRDNAVSDRQQLSGDYQLAQVVLGSALNGKSLSEAGLRDRYRINVVLLTRRGPGERTQALEPAPQLVLSEHDLLIVAGLRENINRFERECGLPNGPVKG